MTTVLAVQGPGWSVIGSDSLVSDEAGRSFMLSSDNPKLFKRGPYVFCIAGDVRAFNLVSHVFNPPKPRSSTVKAMDRFMTASFVPALKQCFDEHGYTVKFDKERDSVAFVVILSVHGIVYEIDEDYSWVRNSFGVYTAGTGCDYAMGSFQALIKERSAADLTIDEASDLVRSSIEVSMMLDSFSGGSVHIVQQHS